MKENHDPYFIRNSICKFKIQKNKKGEKKITINRFKIIIELLFSDMYINVLYEHINKVLTSEEEECFVFFISFYPF